MPPAHPPEFRARAIELAREHAKPIDQIAKDLGISSFPAPSRGWGQFGAESSSARYRTYGGSVLSRDRP